ncbi:OLC1v1001248C1 [Oldenlandia corymbosa var. corymbosa]|uniref:OLC1v1001248C1 n=1 Tax=Oldenlandia corymbosa var. corymbosa TaxID=529605 RepID=A0AAV1D8B9_OLDCO|nr:OLC1v1001248C1 [Oldenlandia corymbosa var. corymbosa]
MSTKVFKGANVFMSRNLVPPELFDSLHDALKLNGAQVFLCCDPARNSANDYHVISNPDHEKFEDLRSKGCNLLGPQCVLSCAKERRPLPKQGFTCCLAMDGVKLLASGFTVDEKAEIVKLVTAMGGVLQMKTSMDVNFVVAKNVLAGKYKWAATVLKKPIVTINWLHQCWKEHRVVPQESYRVLPFLGLTICVTGIIGDERKQMEKVIKENGGRYSAELTRKCTHLVCNAPEGDKYKIARKWGHIHIITQKWLEQSVARRVCLNEESYAVLGSSTSKKVVRKVVVNSEDRSLVHSECEPSSATIASDLHSISHLQKAELDIETAISCSISTLRSDPVIPKVDCGPPAAWLQVDSNTDRGVADDSETEENDLYLSDCRILIVGFDASDTRKLVSMVRKGGGSRYMSFNEKLTHIIVGTPTGSEIREIRNIAALGVIFIVKTEWLEDCFHKKKEVPVLRRHIAIDMLLPKDPSCSVKRSFTSTDEKKRAKSCVQPVLPETLVVDGIKSRSDAALEDGKEAGCIRNSKISLMTAGNSLKQQKLSSVDGKSSTQVQKYASREVDHQVSSNVFGGKLFCFSGSFPADQRAEIVEWVNQGGGEVVESQVENVHYIVECHGMVPSDTTNCESKCVSTHWIRSSLMDGCLLDVRSHILYSPLPCQIPFLAFKSFRFCASQYDVKERLLLKNMCFILGVPFVKHLTKNVTHLLCKYAGGEKYDAACKWGIQPVTAEWIYECVKQNKVVSPSPFCPKEATSQDLGGACTMTQYSTEAVQMMSGETVSQIPSQSTSCKTHETQSFTRKNKELSSLSCPIQASQMSSGEHSSQTSSQSQSYRALESSFYTMKNGERSNLSGGNKKAKIFETNKRDLPFESNIIRSIHEETPLEDNRAISGGVDTIMVPSQSQALKSIETESLTMKNGELDNLSGCYKKAKIFEAAKSNLLCESNLVSSIPQVTPSENNQKGSGGVDSIMVPSWSHVFKKVETESLARRSEELHMSSYCRKNPEISGDEKGDMLCESNSVDGVHQVTPTEDDRTTSAAGVTTVVPDVASIIDLLEQTSKIHDQKSPARSGSDRSVSLNILFECSTVYVSVSSFLFLYL